MQENNLILLKYNKKLLTGNQETKIEQKIGRFMPAALATVNTWKEEEETMDLRINTSKTKKMRISKQEFQSG